ncbi:hypothetical protein BDY19DRAFT_911359 [Irpex rosettiformis]|uniref:Uncharacterized protein n=1 Tax=Irpex rosettiformis TaxID=378272 RepID=A0ACB8UKC8_9APHY|nr:hypothetical protein BDY19DRAFT_911359 [Irpex rosettiformis]
MRDMSADNSNAPLSYDVEPADPHVLDGLELLHFEGRNPALPPMYRYASGVHPQLLNGTRDASVGTAYVYLVDPSDEGRAKFHSLASTMNIPGGMIDEPGGNPGLRGVIVLDEGDVVFARDIGGGGNPEEDIPQVMIATNDGDDDIAAKRASLKTSRDRMLGPRESRDGRRVWFEEQDRAKEVKKKTRCFGLSNMVERPTNASGPPAALKVVNGKLDAVQLAVKGMLQSATDYNITMWSRMAPDALKTVLEKYAELVNTPRIGTFDNYMWSSCQLNLAEPQRVKQEQPLGATNGRFGDGHLDMGDSPTHLSCGTVLSDIPNEPGWEPGRMHFLGIGCYTVLTPFKQFFFTGLQRHGSTRPLVREDLPIPKWACRAMLVCYPSKSIALGKVRHCFGVMPSKRKPFYLTAEMCGGPNDPPSDGFYTTHTSTSQDGTAVMDDPSLLNFHGRGLLSWAHWIMASLPPHLCIEIDSEKFLGAFSYRNGSNRRVGLKPWSMAPSAKVNEPYEDKHVDAQIDVLHVLYDRMAKGIPDLPPNSFHNEYLTNRGSKTRPECKF